MLDALVVQDGLEFEAERGKNSAYDDNMNTLTVVKVHEE